MYQNHKSRIYSLLCSLTGRKFIDALIMESIRRGLQGSGKGPPIRRSLRRIISFTQKREPSPGELDSLIDEMAKLYAASRIRYFTMHYDDEMDLELLPVLRSLLAQGRGVVLATPHFGDTSFLAFALAASADIPVSFMINYARPYRWVTRMIPKLRGVGAGRSAAHCLAALQNNETVLLMTDVDYFPSGRTSDFFGAPFPPPHGTVRLALAADSPILPIYHVFEGGRNRLLCDKPLRVDTGASQEDLERALLRSMEGFIGRYPSHWLVFDDPWDLEKMARHNHQMLQWMWLRWKVDRWLWIGRED